MIVAPFVAYGLTWIRFSGYKLFFIMVIVLLVALLHIAIMLILPDNSFGLYNIFLAIWLAHASFALPMATYLLYNYISSLPRDIVESAFLDGTSHLTIFSKLILPLSMPALIFFAIFQLLWAWTDYLIAIIFTGNSSGIQILTIGVSLSDWQLLTVVTVISLALYLILFFSVQPFLVRGLLRRISIKN